MSSLNLHSAAAATSRPAEGHVVNQPMDTRLGWLAGVFFSLVWGPKRCNVRAHATRPLLLRTFVVAQCQPDMHDRADYLEE